MAKLDVGVGDEFPTEEIRRDPDGTVHHYHYYYRRCRPFGFLRVVLSIVLVFMVLHLLDATSWDMDWAIPFMPHGYMHFASKIIGICVVVAALIFLQRQPWQDRR